jgi:hypothetical protein
MSIDLALFDNLSFFMNLSFFRNFRSIHLLTIPIDILNRRNEFPLVVNLSIHPITHALNNPLRVIVVFFNNFLGFCRQIFLFFFSFDQVFI